MKVRKRLLVSGIVQGVFFRDSARRVARDNQLAGSARNLPDGTLEIVLEGSEGSVAEVIAWTRNGPDLARVEEVEIVDEEPQGLTDFTID